MTVRLYLCRHGTHDEVGRVLSGRSEIALNPEGVVQGAALVERLRGVAVDAIYSSPRRRTMETAAPIALATELRITTSGELDEIDFGTFAGRAFADLDDDPDWHRWNAERDGFRCPDGETMAEATERAWRFLLAAEHSAVVVTHCDIIRGLVARLVGLPFARMFDLPCDPGSLTTLQVERGALRLVTLNERP